MCSLALGILVGFVPVATAQDAGAPGSDADLAQQLQNPIASLISVPFQNNFDFGAGRGDDGFGYTMNFQPVVPFRLSEDWTLITRTIIPFVHQERYSAHHETGLGDTTQSFFFSPRSGVPGLTVGLGPAILWPTATRPAFQSRQLGAGPTGVLVQASGPWTLGLLANHLWGIADSASRQGRPDLNQTFLQPFVSHNFKNGFALTATLESSYDWTGRQWTLPLGAGVSQLVTLGSVPGEPRRPGPLLARRAERSTAVGPALRSRLRVPLRLLHDAQSRPRRRRNRPPADPGRRSRRATGPDPRRLDP